MPNLITDPWPWYIAGPLVGLTVPILLVLGNRSFGVSSNLRHLCAVAGARTGEYFRYDWKVQGSWNLRFLAGLVVGAAIAAWLTTDAPIAISAGTREQLSALGITDFSGHAPSQLFRWQALSSWPSLVALLAGGVCVGFGTAWAGGCTSGHAITGLADLQPASLVATLAFMAGGFLSTYLLLPLLLGGLS
jgi:uncharacterized membrane protein YedE/YeeE